MAVIFSERSRSDITEILEFHIFRDPRYAKGLTDRLIDTTLSLNRFPERGSLSHTESDRAFRRIFESGHAIIYSMTGGDVIIVRILHGARDIDAILAEEP